MSSKNRNTLWRQTRRNPRLGWTIVLTISDLSYLLQTPLPERAEDLKKVWAENWEQIGKQQASVDAVLSVVDLMRDDTLQLLRSLE